MFSIVSTRFPSAIGCNVAKFQRGSLIAHVTILLDDLGLSQNEVRTYLYSQLNDGRYVSGDALDSFVVDNSTTAGAHLFSFIFSVLGIDCRTTVRVKFYFIRHRYNYLLCCSFHIFVCLCWWQRIKMDKKKECILHFSLKTGPK